MELVRDYKTRCLITLATVRGHKLEGDRCTLCDLVLARMWDLPERNCSGMPVCLAQNEENYTYPHEQHSLISLVRARGHKINEFEYCTQCRTSLPALVFEGNRDCPGGSINLAQTGNGKKPVYVYVSGPLTTGQLTKNVRDACGYASALLDKGYAVYLPHANVLWEFMRPATYEAWMQHDLVWVARCDVLFRFPGKSPGGDREVEYATKLGIPVFFDLDSLYAAQPVDNARA